MAGDGFGTFATGGCGEGAGRGAGASAVVWTGATGGFVATSAWRGRFNAKMSNNNTPVPTRIHFGKRNPASGVRRGDSGMGAASFRTTGGAIGTGDSTIG